MLLKVWNHSRNKRKIVKANNLQELLLHGCEKLDILEPAGDLRVVLNTDGTEVEDDEVLQHFSDEVFLLLVADQEWAPQDAPQPMIPTSATHSVASTSKDSPNPTTEKAFDSEPEGPPACKQKETPTTSDVELPTFQPTTLILLQSNNVDEALLAVLREAAVFYYFKYPDMKDSKYYQLIGQKLVRKFPCLAHNGPRPWSFLTGKLSARIRQLRLKDNKKSSDRASSDCCQTAAAPKRFKLERPVSRGRELSDEEFENRIEEVKKEWSGNRSTSVLKLLMADTRQNRRNWRRGKTMKEIMDAFPCLEEGSFILDDFYALINPAQPNKGREFVVENAENLFAQVAKTIPIPLEGGQDSQSLSLVMALERKVAIVKGKGVKSKSAITVIEVDTVDLDDEALKVALKIKDCAAPCLRILITNTLFKAAFVVGDGNVVHCQTTNVLDSLVLLLALYYVMDLQYPSMYGHLLGFLQQFVLAEPYTLFKGTNFQLFSKKIVM